MLFASSNAASLNSLLNDQVERQLTGAQYDTLWRSLKPLYQRVCMRIALGLDVTSQDARVEYAKGTTKSEVPAGTVSDALRMLVSEHVLTRASGARGRYRLDDPLFEEWLRRDGSKLSGQVKHG
jgi:hypothetical protein